MEHERSLNLEAGTTFTLRWWHTGGVGPTAGPCLVCISLLLCHRQPFRMLGLAHIAKRGFCSTQVRTITGIFLFFSFSPPLASGRVVEESLLISFPNESSYHILLIGDSCEKRIIICFPSWPSVVLPEWANFIVTRGMCCLAVSDWCRSLCRL